MTVVTATTAPDFRTLGRPLPRLRAAPGAALELLVVAADGGQCAGVELGSGALVRAWSPAPCPVTLHPFDVVEVVVSAAADAPADPAEPESLVCTDAPEPVGRITGRRAERFLRPLQHPAGRPLLGFHAPAVPFWERCNDRPSIALVDPEGPCLLRRDGDYLACRFAWQGLVRELACLDRTMAAAMDHAGRTRHRVERGTRLVVALTPPIDGLCHKVVEALLPKP